MEEISDIEEYMTGAKVRTDVETKSRTIVKLKIRAISTYVVRSIYLTYSVTS